MRAPTRRSERAIEGLVAVGLLTLDGGVCLPRWAEYQPTKAQLDEERKATARRQSGGESAILPENDGRNGRYGNGVTGNGVK